MDPVVGMPDILSVSYSLGVALHDPHATIVDGHIVILPGFPGSVFDVSFPPDTVGRTPHVIVKLSCFRRGGVVGASAKHPDPVLEDHAATNHATG